MKSINFYPKNFTETTIFSQKQGTIRLGDKTRKYREAVWITVGKPYTSKRKVFTAFIDRILVKKVAHLSKQDLQNEDPEISSIEKIQQKLSETYKTPVSLDDIVTVINFSEVLE